MAEPNIPPPQFGTQAGGMPPPPSQRPAAKKQTVDAAMFEKMSRDVNTIGANLRILEERYALMRSKSQVTEESMIDLEKGLAKDMKGLNDDVTDLKHQLKDIIDKLRLIDAEMKSLTRREDFKVLERYLDMWQPMEFVTKGELDRLIQERKQEAEIPRKKQ